MGVRICVGVEKHKLTKSLHMNQKAHAKQESKVLKMQVKIHVGVEGPNNASGESM
jgi:hypothetical protein